MATKGNNDKRDAPNKLPSKCSPTSSSSTQLCMPTLPPSASGTHLANVLLLSLAYAVWSWLSLHLSPLSSFVWNGHGFSCWLPPLLVPFCIWNWHWHWQCHKDRSEGLPWWEHKHFNLIWTGNLDELDCGTVVVSHSVVLCYCCGHMDRGAPQSLTFRAKWP